MWKESFSLALFFSSQELPRSRAVVNWGVTRVSPRGVVVRPLVVVREWPGQGCNRARYSALDENTTPRHGRVERLLARANGWADSLVERARRAGGAGVIEQARCRTDEI